MAIPIHLPVSHSYNHIHSELELIIHRVITDRFAPPNGDNGTPCNTDDRRYCGGTWQTVISKLDYIQGMGYDAVWISPTALTLEGKTVSTDLMLR
jgi:hypothetical protein